MGDKKRKISGLILVGTTVAGSVGTAASTASAGFLEKLQGAKEDAFKKVKDNPVLAITSVSTLGIGFLVTMAYCYYSASKTEELKFTLTDENDNEKNLIDEEAESSHLVNADEGDNELGEEDNELGEEDNELGEEDNELVKKYFDHEKTLNYLKKPSFFGRLFGQLFGRLGQVYENIKTYLDFNNLAMKEKILENYTDYTDLTNIVDNKPNDTHKLVSENFFDNLEKESLRYLCNLDGEKQGTYWKVIDHINNNCRKKLAELMNKCTDLGKLTSLVSDIVPDESTDLSNLKFPVLVKQSKLTKLVKLLELDNVSANGLAKLIENGEFVEAYFKKDGNEELICALVENFEPSKVIKLIGGGICEVKIDGEKIKVNVLSKWGKIGLALVEECTDLEMLGCMCNEGGNDLFESFSKTTDNLELIQAAVKLVNRFGELSTDRKKNKEKIAQNFSELFKELENNGKEALLKKAYEDNNYSKYNPLGWFGNHHSYDGFIEKLFTCLHTLKEEEDKTIFDVEEAKNFVFSYGDPNNVNSSAENSNTKVNELRKNNYENVEEEEVENKELYGDKEMKQNVKKLGNIINYQESRKGMVNSGDIEDDPKADLVCKNYGTEGEIGEDTDI